MLKTAVITTGGLGTRLLTYTKSNPKTMLPLYDKSDDRFSDPLLRPLIELIFERLYDCGFRRFCFIVGEKTKKSILVFNTPSVHNCHGWRISENLALGKAIISTKFSNELPVSLEHGKNIHFISNNKDFKLDFDKIINSREYRLKLENEAKKYFIEYVSPEKVIKSIVSGNIENHCNE